MLSQTLHADLVTRCREFASAEYVFPTHITVKAIWGVDRPAIEVHLFNIGASEKTRYFDATGPSLLVFNTDMREVRSRLDLLEHWIACVAPVQLYRTRYIDSLTSAVNQVIRPDECASMLVQPFRGRDIDLFRSRRLIAEGIDNRYSRAWEARKLLDVASRLLSAKSVLAQGALNPPRAEDLSSLPPYIARVAQAFVEPESLDFRPEAEPFAAELGTALAGFSKPVGKPLPFGPAMKWIEGQMRFLGQLARSETKVPFGEHEVPPLTFRRAQIGSAEPPPAQTSDQTGEEFTL